MIQVGDRVHWTSQSQGVWKEKVGRVVAIVPKESKIEPFLVKAVGKVPKSRIKWSDSVSKSDRAVVAVERPAGKDGRHGGYDYYAPRLSVLRKCEEEQQ